MTGFSGFFPLILVKKCLRYITVGSGLLEEPLKIFHLCLENGLQKQLLCLVFCLVFPLSVLRGHFISPLPTPQVFGPPRSSFLNIVLNPSIISSSCYNASKVGEFKESEDWSPLLLLRRWAFEQDSEEEAGDSCSNTLG